MSFDYNQIREHKHTGETQWAAYSDLFMVLAFIFLLMYMVSSLRTGMESITTHAEIEEIKEEIKLYESTKKQYISGIASEQEKKAYKEIINQISLLEGKANKNKIKLAKEYKEQRILESSLNQYQKTLETMMKANAIAKAESAKIINEQERQNERLKQNIKQKESSLSSLKGRIALEQIEMASLRETHDEETRRLESKYTNLKDKNDNNKEDIATLNEMLKREAEEKSHLKNTHTQEIKNHEMKFENIKEMRISDQDKLDALESKLREETYAMNDLKSAHFEETRNLNRKIDRITENNNENINSISNLKEELRNETNEKLRLKRNLSKESETLKDKIQNLKSNHERNQREIAGLEDQIKRESDKNYDLEITYSQQTRDQEKDIRNLKDKNNRHDNLLASLEGKLRKNEDEKNDLKETYSRTKNDLEDKISNLVGKNQDNKKELASLQRDNRGKLDKLNSDLDNAKINLKNTSKELNKAQSTLADKSQQLENALALEKHRRDIAKRINDNFKEHGINADVNKETGDVILDFGDSYFATDSHQLKPGMKQTIRKAIPVYAQSLLGSKLLAASISSVQIIGFSSPTYGGKPVDPTELSIENRSAVNYNLDLSYRRARSIFKYVFDTEKIKFKHQEQMVHLINVTGRSFFAEKVDIGDTGGLSIDAFCELYHCEKSQRVIIKFGLSEKGEA